MYYLYQAAREHWLEQFVVNLFDYNSTREVPSVMVSSCWNNYLTNLCLEIVNWNATHLNISPTLREPPLRILLVKILLYLLALIHHHTP